MRITIDTEKRTLHYQEGDENRRIELYSKDAFYLISRLWLKVGWNEKYSYTFSWMGRPIIQLPEDMLRIQEVIYRVKPDVILETGVAHGGSLVYYASLCNAIGKGRVIGVDIEIHKQNRIAIEEHALSPFITMIEGDSVSAEVLDHVKALIQPGETVLVILDSNHTCQHVLAELEAYQEFVTPGSYIVATDGVMRDLFDVPRGHPDWIDDNPVMAARQFADSHANFDLEQPKWLFNESDLGTNLTYWPDAWLRRI